MLSHFLAVVFPCGLLEARLFCYSTDPPTPRVFLRGPPSALVSVDMV